MGEHAPFAAQNDVAVLQRDLEPEDDAGRPRVGADENDARFADGFELALEERLFRLVRSHDADSDRRTRGIVGHVFNLP